MKMTSQILTAKLLERSMLRRVLGPAFEEHQLESHIFAEPPGCQQIDQESSLQLEAATQACDAEMESHTMRGRRKARMQRVHTHTLIHVLA